MKPHAARSAERRASTRRHDAHEESGCRGVLPEDVQLQMILRNFLQFQDK
jgi:hypothetical protein